MPFNPFAAGPAEPVAEPSPAEPADGGATRESDVDDGWWDFGSGPDAADATADPDPADDAADDGRRDADGRGGRSEDAPDPMPDDGADDDWWGMASDAGGDDAPPARTARDPAGPAAHAGDDTDADDDWWGMAGGDGPRSDDADPTTRLVSVPGTSVRIPADFDWGTDTPAAGPADGVREPAPAPARRPGPSRRILIAATAAILALVLLAGGVVAARTLIASDRQRKAHDEACATLTAQAGTWDGLARQAKTLGVKPGDGPDTSCKADTDTLKARARTLKARARTLARANRNALDAAWENLSGRIAASRKNHPKAGGQTLAALETLAETAPEDADGLAAKEREFERLDKQAGREQQQAEQEEKAEAEAKRKAEREAEARREAEAQDTPQAAAPTPAPMPQTTPTPAPQPTPTPTPTPAPGNADASM
ncbi:hypothetical protein ACTPOJ_05730 [Bifidobacterium longum]|uniref:hypothetical protein n=1 Tax=Bifidobacterium longum TaxID=216816 RepID=UPI003FCD49E0